MLPCLSRTSRSEALEPQNVQETSDCVIPKGKPEEEAGLPRHGQETVQESSAPQVRQRPSEPHVEVVSRVRKPLKLDEAVKRQLERHMVKMQIQRCFGLPKKVLASYKKLSETTQELQDYHPPPHRHTVLPYRSPFQHWDRHARTRKRAVQPLARSKSPQPLWKHAHEEHRCLPTLCQQLL